MHSIINAYIISEDHNLIAIVPSGCQVHRLHGIVSFAVKVQSAATHPAALLRERVAEWLVAFREELQDLPEEKLSHFKVGDIQGFCVHRMLDRQFLSDFN